ncbi:P26-1 [Trabala vishnou gigantina nucleopolyhedrovirus]|uniref:P26-1 n=1 Tax=Trabala vishnou gigantina nucleopolyhedrovirus TaxID=2863583 RepID=UPI002481AA46|nr:P26-1 [Trabala vishnou gigantina nucleopolyhedrovirus]QYC92712.1 P26-1 [Trabala vishnou gigantina nucleopolyhedrovirus]
MSTMTTKLFLVVTATFIMSVVMQGAVADTVYNIDYTIDHDTKTITVNRVDNELCSIVVVAPNGHTNNHETLDIMHHFPGAVSSVILPGAAGANSILHVLANDGTLLRVEPEHVYANFHVHKRQMVYGQLRTFALDDFSLAEKIYIGAPIFMGNKLVSVVTCRFDNYARGLVMFPVTGARSTNLISGRLEFDSEVKVREWNPIMSIYGKMQLPYHTDSVYDMNAKRFEISSRNNRRMYRNMPRSVTVFHNERDTFIVLVEGEFEIAHVHFDGPMVVPQKLL